MSPRRCLLTQAQHHPRAPGACLVSRAGLLGGRFRTTAQKTRMAGSRLRPSFLFLSKRRPKDRVARARRPGSQRRGGPLGSDAGREGHNESQLGLRSAPSSWTARGRARPFWSMDASLGRSS